VKTHAIGLASAFRTLTILPFPGNECEDASTTLYWFPVVGLFLGLCVASIGVLLGEVTSSFLSGAISVGLLAYLTRGFHLDGLADMADGFGGGWERERILAIMKDSHIGAFGMITVVLTLIIKTAAITTVLDRDNWILIAHVIVFSRLLVVMQAVVNPYARTGGGTAGQLVTNARWRHLAAASVLTVGCSLLLKPVQLLPLAWILASGLVTTFVIAWRSRVRIGGVTGDILGATVETSETVMFTVLACLPYLQ
jgi:adenosylcobinamide-GDP ribazoletransferase